MIQATNRTFLDYYPPLDLGYLQPRVRLFHEMDDGQKRAFLEKVLQAHPPLNFDIQSPNMYYRVRKINGKNIQRVTDVLWPQQLQNTSNRFGNFCYIANTLNAALAEKYISSGDEVVATRFTMRKDAQAHTLPVGVHESIMHSGRILYMEDEKARRLADILRECQSQDPDATMAFLLQDIFLSSLMQGKNIEFSQLAMESLIAKINTPIDTIIYPSTRLPNSHNLAVKTDRFMDMWDIVGITKYYVDCMGLGLYSVIPMAHVTTVNPEGTLLWETAQDDADNWLPISPAPSQIP